MGLHHQDLPEGVLGALRNGAVIPAHPLALDRTRALDDRRQRALSRYYVDAGVSGLAVGVHTTQFAIREKGAIRSRRRFTRRDDLRVRSTRTERQSRSQCRGIACILPVTTYHQQPSAIY
jgi:hypothetical protein